MSPSTRPAVLVVIADYNSSADTLRCLAALRRADPAGFEVRPLVVDNSDRDPFPRGAAPHVIRPQRNVGLGGAWRIGYEQALASGAAHCLFLNNDAELAPDFFRHVQASLARWGPRTAIGPRISRRDRPEVVWSRGGRIDPLRVRVVHFGEGQPCGPEPLEDTPTGHLSGCCLFVPTPLLAEIGGPDARFFFRGEEWDLNHRLARAGVRLILCDRARVLHAVGASHDRFSPRMLYFAYRAKVLFARKHHPPPWFPLWYLGGLVYAATLAPAKFARLAGGRGGSGTGEVRRALVRAFLHGLFRDAIREADAPPAARTRRPDAGATRS